LKNIQIENFKKIRQVGAELFHAGGRTDRSDEANTRFSQFCVTNETVWSVKWMA